MFVVSDGTGGSRETPKSLRQVAFGVATLSLHILSGSCFELQRLGFSGGQLPGRQTVPRAELWRIVQALCRVDEKPNIQLSIDAKNVTEGFHTEERVGIRAECGPVLDPSSID